METAAEHEGSGSHIDSYDFGQTKWMEWNATNSGS